MSDGFAGRLRRAASGTVAAGLGAAADADTSRELFLAIAELARRRDAPVSSEPSLGAHELRVFSQNGEDGVIAEITRRCGIRTGYFVEFGASDGQQNNCVALAELAGWSGLFIEGDDDAFARLERRFSGNSRVKTRQAMVAPETIEALFTAEGVPVEPDLLCIDIDGQDYYVWEAIERFSAKVVIVEYNGTLPADRRLVEPAGGGDGWTGGDAQFGASAAALRSLGESKGYRLVHTDLSGVNAFFVRNDVPGDFPADVPLHTANYHMRGVELFGQPDVSAFRDLDAEGA